jgi:DNA-binding response OmpR family regulator
LAGERILIIEDDQALRFGLMDALAHRGYSVGSACDGEQGLQHAIDETPDLILLDVMLPKVNGYEICRLIRAEGRDVPIIMLTAKDQESDIVLGLNLGADDYVTKPFGIQVLLARIDAALRRRRQIEGRRHLFGEFEFNLDARRLLRNGVEVSLRPKEFALLWHLVKRAGCALTRDQILKAVWGYDVAVTERSVDRCVATLRERIEVDSRHPIFIQTIRDVGYRFEAADLRTE